MNKNPDYCCVPVTLYDSIVIGRIQKDSVQAENFTVKLGIRKFDVRTLDAT